MTLKSFELYQVGGCVRDQILGLETNDYDYTAVLRWNTVMTVAQVFNLLDHELEEAGFVVFLRKPEYLTIRAKFPVDHEHKGMVADFVLARKEGPYTDGRRPEWVLPGLLSDDLARRDFTMNAMAIDEAGVLHDPFGGQQDMKDRIINCVGRAHERLQEDALRAIRALRFAVTKNMDIGAQVKLAMSKPWLLDMVRVLDADRKRAELDKMFRFDTVLSLQVIAMFDRHPYEPLSRAIFTKGVWLMPTQKDV